MVEEVDAEGLEAGLEVGLGVELYLKELESNSEWKTKQKSMIVVPWFSDEPLLIRSQFQYSESANCGF